MLHDRRFARLTARLALCAALAAPAAAQQLTPGERARVDSAALAGAAPRSWTWTSWGS